MCTTNTTMKVLALSFFMLILSGCEPVGDRAAVYININTVLSYSLVAEQEGKHLNEVMDVLKKGAISAEDNYKGMEREKAEKAKLSDLQILSKLWFVEQEKARTSTLQSLRSEAEKFAKDNDYRLILDYSSIIYADPKRDVTGEFMKTLKNIHITYPSLPEISAVDKRGEKK